MGNSSLTLKFAFALSLSLAVSSSSPSSLFFPFLPSHLTVRSSSSSPQKLASDLISLLGSTEQASRIITKEAHDLKSCLRFLVPFSSNSTDKIDKFPVGGRDLSDCQRRGIVSDQKKKEEDEKVWWPLVPVMELARLTVDSGGDVAAIQRTLDPTPLTIPDFEGSKMNRCELTRTLYGHRFINKELNSYLAFLFEIIAARGPSVGLNISLNRYDLFHGHLFLATDSGRLGILFHAKEYPAFDKENFPYNMGFCQIGSNLRYDDSINLRNILWLAPLPSNVTKAWLAPGALVILDACPEGIIYKEMIHEYVHFVRTIYEDDFGEVAVDVNYFNLGNVDAGDNIFIC